MAEPRADAWQNAADPDQSDGLMRSEGDPREPNRPARETDGLTALDDLLSAMEPVLVEGEFVFCTVPNAGYGAYAGHEPIASFVEQEGLTLVLPRERADAAALRYRGIFRMITLTVHSSLEAVGLSAAVTTCLAERGISANVIAAHYHDHIFVPADAARSALQALQDLSAKASSRR